MMRVVMKPRKTTQETITFLREGVEITLSSPVVAIVPDEERLEFLSDSRVVISPRVDIATLVS